MLIIKIPGKEAFDEERQEFIQTKDQVLSLEHSLVAISKWESKWHKPFLDDSYDKTEEQTLDYIKCMTITQNVDPNAYYCLTGDILSQIKEYINDPMTATWFSNESKIGPKKSRIVTSELIYYWMVALQIPFECQKWHINRLLTLIKVCNEENKPPKKKSKREIMSRNKALNEARKKQMNTRG